MPKSIFDHIMGWPYHPQAIIALGFVSCFVISMHNDTPAWWAALVVSVFFAPIAGMLLFLPYLAGVVIFAALLSLPRTFK